jgi:hypothetical protein
VPFIDAAIAFLLARENAQYMAVKLFLHRNLQLWSARGPEAPYRAQTGESLDPYLILELLVTGGTGRSIRARDIRLSREMAQTPTFGVPG